MSRSLAHHVMSAIAFLGLPRRTERAVAMTRTASRARGGRRVDDDRAGRGVDSAAGQGDQQGQRQGPQQGGGTLHHGTPSMVQVAPTVSRERPSPA